MLTLPYAILKLVIHLAIVLVTLFVRHFLDEKKNGKDLRPFDIIKTPVDRMNDDAKHSESSTITASS